MVAPAPLLDAVADVVEAELAPRDDAVEVVPLGAPLEVAVLPEVVPAVLEVVVTVLDAVDALLEVRLAPLPALLDAGPPDETTAADELIVVMLDAAAEELAALAELLSAPPDDDVVVVVSPDSTGPEQAAKTMSKKAGTQRKRDIMKQAPAAPGRSDFGHPPGGQALRRTTLERRPRHPNDNFAPAIAHAAAASGNRLM